MFVCLIGPEKFDPTLLLKQITHSRYQANVQTVDASCPRILQINVHPQSSPESLPRFRTRWGMNIGSI